MFTQGVAMTYFGKEPHARVGGNDYLIKRFRDSNVFEVLETLNNACYVDIGEEESWQAVEALQIARGVQMARDIPAYDSEGRYL